MLIRLMPAHPDNLPAAAHEFFQDSGPAHVLRVLAVVVQKFGVMKQLLAHFSKSPP